ncbi:MAG: CCA tRNA nucleotidyltransferase [Alphaproteobacteria bacterium]
MAASPDVVRIGVQPWMRAPNTRQVLAALEGGGAAARFVGGCVRDAVLGRRVGDVDVATPLPPQEVMRRLEQAGIKAVPTGIDHGTITAVFDKAVDAPIYFEVTTLRLDMETDGRRARVAFTDDWAADAARRDFTINALFCDASGKVYDYTGGLGDLRDRRVRFVGDPTERIREDVLRLLRFFRFYAHYGDPPPDGPALDACAELAHLLPTLSGERVAGELFKLLDAADPATVLRLMAERGILGHVLPEARAIDRLAALVSVEGTAGADHERRLAALLDVDETAADRVALRLRLSNAQGARLASLVAPTELDPGLPVRRQRELLYRMGRSAFQDRVLMAWAGAVAGEAPPGRRTTEAWRELLDLPERWTPPVFPIKGRDALALGIEPGPQVGKALDAVERWWIAGDFAAGREACLDRLRAALEEGEAS